MKNDYEKPKLGDEFWLVEMGANVRHKNPLRCKCVVSKVGRKYFTVSVDSWLKEVVFHISTRSEKTDYCSDWELFESKQAFDDYEELHVRLDAIETAFGVYGRGTDYTLAQLREVCLTLGIEI